MKRKLIAGGVLIVVCLGLLVVEGVSQPPETVPPMPASYSASPSPSPTLKSRTVKQAPDFSTVKQQQEWTFEQLAEALKAVRARQKELKAQEVDLLAKMAERIEEKRKDLQKAEETLQQFQGAPKGPQTVIGTGGACTTLRPRH